MEALYICWYDCLPEFIAQGEYVLDVLQQALQDLSVQISLA